MLKVDGLHVRYGVIPALKGISFYIAHGEIVALIGANGVGKTTALHCISGIVKAAGGSITFNGQNITNMPAHKIVALGISQAPEGRGVFPNLTVWENLSLGAYLRHDKNEIENDRKMVCQIFPRLKERQNQAGGTLSGGEQQMLAIGRALMARPKLLLLDEPSMGLAPIVVEDIFKTIRRINKQNKTTILLVEQNAQMALMLSNRAYVLETGEIIATGNSRDLIGDEQIKKSYLGL
ncbi:MAG: ABC transporter ATP-binding protein [Acidaminococcales bacterium]|jgi:branched-chain amino acid transport system ATP-binding protein|nr:ABC transporter ATP-binding protein [Acidaminococcales bacterium]